jgi:hypothetical protein
MSAQTAVQASIVVTIVAAYLLHIFDLQELVHINSTPPDAYIQSELELHQHGIFFDFFVTLIMGALYFGAVEGVAFVVRKILPKKTT